MARQETEQMDPVASLLAPIPSEELQMLPPLTEEAIVDALRQGKAERDAVAASAQPVSLKSRVLFR